MRFSLANEIWNSGLWGLGEVWPTLRSRKSFPAVNVYGNDDKLVVTSEIPGLSVDDLEVSVHGRTLTLKGKRELPAVGEEERVVCGERTGGEFERSIGLPIDIESAKVEAAYHHGVLTVKLPRSEATKPRKIEVRAA